MSEIRLPKCTICGGLGCDTCGTKCNHCNGSGIEIPNTPASDQPEKCVHCGKSFAKHSANGAYCLDNEGQPFYRFTSFRPIADQPEYRTLGPDEVIGNGTQSRPRGLNGVWLSDFAWRNDKVKDHPDYEFRRPIAAEKREDTRTCGELSCDECNERYQKAIAEISTLQQSVAGWQRLIAALRGDVSGLEARISWLITENESLQKQFGVCSICGFIAWKSRETQPGVEDCQYCARVVENERLQKLNDIMHKFSVFCHSKTCVDHTDAERQGSGCPVCLQKQLAQEKEAREKAETLIRHLPCHCGNFGPNLKCPCCQAKAAIQQSEGN